MARLSLTAFKFSERPLPLLSIVIAQQLVLLPLYFFIPLWVSLLCFITAVTIIYADKSQKFKIERWLKVVITLIAIAGVLLTFKKISGRDAGVALISVMYGLKILEMRSRRDANLILNLGFFMLVAGFLFSQKPWIALYQILPIIAILNALVAMQSLQLQKSSHHSEQWVIARLVKSLGQYLLLALPIMIILFVFFPRLSDPIWRMPGASNSTSGVSDTMTPGDISSLKLSDKVAFRAEFKNKEPNSAQMYWRVLVLDQFDGLTWSRAGEIPINDPYDQKSLVGYAKETYEYSISLEPTQQRFLVTLDKPVISPSNGRLLNDYVTYSKVRLLDRVRYQGISSPQHQIELDMSQDRKKRFTRLSKETFLGTNFPSVGTGNPKSRLWAVQQRKKFADDKSYIQSLLNSINQQEYFYTLSPPAMEENMVDSFWFDIKKGFCEHYAGALVFLARAADIPARVVIGYQGGDKNPLSNYWIVRNENAHAWTEIWIEGEGWLKVDPTSAIAPHRVEKELLSDYRQRESLFDNFNFDLVELDDMGLLKQFEYWSDQFNNRWNDWILDYNEQSQYKLFKSWGLSSLTSQHMVIIMIILVTGFVLLTSAKWFHQKQNLTPLAKAYLRLLKKLDKKNIIVFDPQLGPYDLNKKLSQQGVIRYRQLILLINEYIQLRYQNENPDKKQILKLLKQLKKVHLKNN